jgi:hypothetical protein
MQSDLPSSTKCPHCGANLYKPWHTLTPGLVKALSKFYKEICENGKNEWNRKGNELSKNEDSNLTKLRFHGLIAKVYDEQGKRVGGAWLITKRGVDFLKGGLEIPSRVQTFRNRVVDHDPKKVNLREVMQSEPYWEQEFAYDIFEPQQGTLI